MQWKRFPTGDFQNRHVFKNMNNYSLTGAQMIDPDMRFNPRDHIFLLPVCSVKTDFADARSADAGRGVHLNSLFERFFGHCRVLSGSRR